MKKETFDEMIKLANKLDNIGLYKEASKVDRIAQYIQFNPWGKYEYFINEYKRHFIEDGADYASKWMNSLLRWKSQPGGYGNWSKDTRDAFVAQAGRITLKPKAQEFSNNVLPALIKQYSIETITDKAQLDYTWTILQNYAEQQYGGYYGDSVGAVLRKTKPIYDAKIKKFNR